MEKKKVDLVAAKKELYTDMNKLPTLLGDYRISGLKYLKKRFHEQLDEVIAREKKYCTEQKIPMIMTGTTLKLVEDVIERCTNIFEIEALARFLFDENEIPTYPDVQNRGRAIQRVFPMLYKN